ncbi:hypothetical protein ACT2CV_01270 [Pasteurellaceae bacterium 22721_9_1]
MNALTLAEMEELLHEFRVRDAAVNIARKAENQEMVDFLEKTLKTLERGAVEEEKAVFDAVVRLFTNKLKAFKSFVKRSL